MGPRLRENKKTSQNLMMNTQISCFEERLRLRDCVELTSICPSSTYKIAGKYLFILRLSLEDLDSGGAEQE